MCVCVLRLSARAYVLVIVALKRQHFSVSSRLFVSRNHNARARHYNDAFLTLDTFFSFFSRSLNLKKSRLRQQLSLPAPVLFAIWIDGRSIPAAGDNHSVSASTDPNSYLFLPTASTLQMTTGTCISLYCSKAPRGEYVCRT